MVNKLKAKINDIEEITPEIRIYKLKTESKLLFKAGQFINIKTTNNNNQRINRAYSIASKPQKEGNKEIELCIKKVEGGEFTPKLWQMQKGDELDIMGPLGLFFPKYTNKLPYITLIATGVGITPIKSIIENTVEQDNKEKITLLYGTRYEEQLCYNKRFTNLEKTNKKFTYFPTLSKPNKNWNRYTGYVQNHLNKIDNNTLLNSEILICGSKKMIEETLQTLNKLGIPDENIKTEKF